MKHFNKITILTLALGALLLSGSAAKADEITVSITPSTQTVVAGDTTPLDFYATITDTDPLGSNPLYVYGYEVTTASGPSAALSNSWDDSGFYANFWEIDPQQSITNQLIFAVTVSDPTTPAGLDIFGIQFTGDPQGDLLDPTNAAFFSINVTSPVPEPSSLLLMVSGLAGLAAAARRKLLA